MKRLQWNPDKSKSLQATRGIDFDTVALAINQGNILDIIEHPNQEKYPSQRIFVLAINQYVYLVPFVESEHAIFLKTIIPSRKMKKKYLGEADDE
ncbi:MAG: BrnT family toxin [Leptolyngbyaceae cyanobacterium]